MRFIHRLLASLRRHRDVQRDVDAMPTGVRRAAALSFSGPSRELPEVRSILTRTSARLVETYRGATALHERRRALTRLLAEEQRVQGDLGALPQPNGPLDATRIALERQRALLERDLMDLAERRRSVEAARAAANEAVVVAMSEIAEQGRLDANRELALASRLRAAEGLDAFDDLPPAIADELFRDAIREFGNGDAAA